MSGSVKDAIAHARNNRERSIATLIDLVKIPSLTGEEGNAQIYISELLNKAGADVEMEEPDVAGLFESFPHIAQYPTHWQHDLILPYADLPTHESLKESGLESVLNYDKRPNVVGSFKGVGGGRSLILNGHIDTVTIEPLHEWTREPFGAVGGTRIPIPVGEISDRLRTLVPCSRIARAMNSPVRDSATTSAGCSRLSSHSANHRA